MFAEFLIKDEFYKKYFELLNMRLAIGNVEMENRNGNIDLTNKTIELYNNINAFSNILEKNPERLTPYDVVDVAEDVNNNINFFDKGFRKTQVEVIQAKNFFPIEAQLIPQAMYSLFDSYHNIWNILPIYEKEARLHIELVRMQPFEDGNKRTARTITNFNLCKQNKAPVIISGNETDTYFDFIDNYDVIGFSNFLKQKSEEELVNMLDLYRAINGDSFELEPVKIDLNDGDVRIYEMARESVSNNSKESFIKIKKK